jgi:hypothetical protein
MHFDWDPSKRVKILFFGITETKFKNFSQKLFILICPRSVRLFKVINHCCNLKTHGGDTFWKNNPVSFENTFLIGRAIHHFRFFSRMQDFCSNTSVRGNTLSSSFYSCNYWPLKTPFFAFKCDHPLKPLKPPRHKAF